MIITITHAFIVHLFSSSFTFFPPFLVSFLSIPSPSIIFPCLFLLHLPITVPVASPTDCTNITFLPLSTTLGWTEPDLIDQNGAPVGYNLTCTSDTDGIAVSGLNATQFSTDTMFIVTDVMPFTAYTCELRFINVIGQGPPTWCRFETAQDSKWLKDMYMWS